MWPSLTGFFHLVCCPGSSMWWCQRFIPFYGWVIFHCMAWLHFVPPFFRGWTFGMCPHVGYCECCCYEHVCTCLCLNTYLKHLFGSTPRSGIAGSRERIEEPCSLFLTPFLKKHQLRSSHFSIGQGPVPRVQGNLASGCFEESVGIPQGHRSTWLCTSGRATVGTHRQTPPFQDCEDRLSLVIQPEGDLSSPLSQVLCQLRQKPQIWGERRGLCNFWIII